MDQSVFPSLVGWCRFFGDCLEEATGYTVWSCCFPWLQIQYCPVHPVFADSEFGHVWVSALFKRGQVLKVFPGEDVIELFVEDVCLGRAFAKGEFVLLEGGNMSAVSLILLFAASCSAGKKMRKNNLNP